MRPESVEISPVKLPDLCEVGDADCSLYTDWRTEILNALPDEGDSSDHLYYFVVPPGLAEGKLPRDMTIEEIKQNYPPG